MKKKVTMQAIADELKLSKSLVSKALANQSGVSEETKELIRLTAMKLGYRINSSNKSIASSKTGNVVTLIPREDLSDFEYWGKIVRGIEEALSEMHFSMILSGIDISLPTSDGMPTSVSDRKVDGAIILGNIPPAYILAVQSTGIPVVLIDVHYNQLKLDHVLAENYSGGYDAAHYLIDYQHRKIGFVGDISYSYSFTQRFHGFNAAISEFNSRENSGIEAWHFIGSRQNHHTPYSPEELEVALTKPDRPTALVCGNDPIAFDVLQQLEKLNIRCPEDISIIGFDNVQKCDWVTPALTSIDACKDQFGIRAVQMLFRRMDNPEIRSEHTMISTEIIERSSVASLQS
ncbi:LacI family DNA-binding transcriptional regulator [Paenibacillus agaridevorans]|uniref:LacI family DNA-binding transcriptional regulator n=1 Tax=Paenibacillus agaridevorans TaxID=171404 RepID=UPI001BE4448D|nr:LacI family DNA-binding transcriptional regulator [Paenibacillus agaridevorans]